MYIAFSWDAYECESSIPLVMLRPMMRYQIFFEYFHN